jgi:hypothetical protein
MVGRNFNLQGSWSKLAETFLCGRACRLVAGLGVARGWYLIGLGRLLNSTVRRVVCQPVAGAQSGIFWLRFQSIALSVATPSVASDLFIHCFVLGGFLLLFHHP